MEKIIKWMGIIMVAMLVVIIALTTRNCKSLPEIGELRGEIALRDTLIEGGRQDLKTADRQLALERKAHDRLMGELNGMIDSSNTVIARLMEEDAVSERRIGELEALHPESPTEEEIIDNWQERTELWKNRFSLCQAVIVEKDTIIFSLSQKYEAESQLRSRVEGLLGGYKTQVSLLETQLHSTASLTATLERKLKYNKSVKTVSVLAFVGAVVYLLVQK